MPSCRYVEEISSATMLATKRSAGVAAEVNLSQYITHMPQPSVEKDAHFGFETQKGHHQKFKTGVSVVPQKGLEKKSNYSFDSDLI